MIRDNVFKMIERRGWSVESIPCDTRIIAINSRNEKVVIFFFMTDEKVNIDAMSSVINNEYGSRNIIIIYKKSLTPDAKTVARMNRVFVIELFHSDEFSYDLVEHIPMHRLHDKSKSPKFKEWNKLPIILSNDIVVRYFGFKIDDVIEIDEDFGRGVEVSLRRVVRGF